MFHTTVHTTVHTTGHTRVLQQFIPQFLQLHLSQLGLGTLTVHRWQYCIPKHVLTYPCFADAEQGQASADSQKRDPACPAMHAVDVAVQTDLPCLHQPTEPQEVQLSAGVTQELTACSAIAEDRSFVQPKAVLGPCQDTATSGVEQLQTDGSDNDAAQHSPGPRQQQGSNRSGMLADQATVSCNSSARESSGANEEVRDRRQDVSKSSRAQHSSVMAEQLKPAHRGSGGSTACRTEEDKVREKVATKGDAEHGIVQGTRIRQEARKKAVGHWTQGLQLPEQLTVSILAKHAGVDKVFMQVCFIYYDRS